MECQPLPQGVLRVRSMLKGIHRGSLGVRGCSPAQDQDATNRRIVDRATQTLAMMQQHIEATLAGDAGVYDMRDIVESIIRESEIK